MTRLITFSIMSRRKQTNPSPLEESQMDFEKSRISASHIDSEVDDNSLTEDYMSLSTSSLKQRSVTEKSYSLNHISKKTADKRVRDFSDSEEESVVPYKLYQELQDGYVVLRKHLREKDMLIAEKDATIRRLREKHTKMAVELDKIRQLNICLQEHLLLKEAAPQVTRTTLAEDTESFYEPTENVMLSEVKSQSEYFPETHVENNSTGKVDLGHGVLLDRQKWQAIQRKDSHSKFCKSLAVAIWGIETLKERSVTGSKSNAIKGSVAKPPLSPKKVGIIRDCLKERLQQRGYQKEAVDGQLSLVRRYLSEKICDIKRKASVNSEGRAPAHPVLPPSTDVNQHLSSLPV